MGMDRTLYAIVNPASASGRTKQAWPAILDKLGARGYVVEAYETVGPGDATRVARMLVQRGVPELVAVGGDGTLNEVVNGFFTEDGEPISAQTILSVIPAGTGRDLSRTLGIRDIDHALDVLGSSTVQRIDVGLAHHHVGTEERCRCFVNMADVGLGAAVWGRVGRPSKRLGGRLTYLIWAGPTMLVFFWEPATVMVDGQVFYDGPVGMVVLANGRFHAGGMRMAPMASLADGRFEVLVLEDVPRPVLLGSLLPRVYRGTHISHPNVRHCQGREVMIRAPEPLLFEMDGEQVGMTDVTARVVASAIALRVPPDLKLVRQSHPDLTGVDVSVTMSLGLACARRASPPRCKGTCVCPPSSPRKAWSIAR